MPSEEDGLLPEDLKPDADPEYLTENNNDEDEYEPGCEGAPRRNAVLLRIVALITVLAFLGLVITTSWPNHRQTLTDLVEKSLKLKKDVDTDLMQAVVQIDVVSPRSQGATFVVEQKTGTGFNIETGGLIVTNYHVIEGALNMNITFPDGKVYRADRWSGKPESDLAVIVLRADGLPAVPVDFSSPPAPEDKIRVIGNPLTLNNILVEGKVGQYLRVKDMKGKIFSIDAPIYPGNSGSPVFDMNDRVVGVVFGTLQGKEDGGEKVTGLAVAIGEVLDILSSVRVEQNNE